MSNMLMITGITVVAMLFGYFWGEMGANRDWQRRLRALAQRWRESSSRGCADALDAFLDEKEQP